VKKILELNSVLCIDIIDSFKVVTQALEQLRKQVCEFDKNLPFWFKSPDQLNYIGIANREQVCTFIEQLEYLDGQDPKETLLGPGLIAASSETIASVAKLNIAKENFKAAILRLRHSQTNYDTSLLHEQMETLLKKRECTLASNLKRIGLARLHLKQCYRLLPILPKHPFSVAWTWANTKAIRRVSIDDAKNMLAKQGTDDKIKQQMKKLSTLSDNEVLAVVQELAPHLRANVLFKTLQCSERKMFKGPVPIFFPFQASEPFPQVKPPKSKQTRDSNRLQRNDTKLEAEPFLPTIHVHRYMADLT